MDANRTSLSAGLIIGGLLGNDERVMEMATKVFPVVTDSATLPYVSYRCLKMEAAPVKHAPSADTLFAEICCFSDSYAGSVDLAESVRSVLDGVSAEMGNLSMRSCFLEDREETFTDDAFLQRLIFRIRI